MADTNTANNLALEARDLENKLLRLMGKKDLDRVDFMEKQGYLGEKRNTHGIFSGKLTEKAKNMLK